MSKYQKRPLVIEAWQIADLQSDDTISVPRWLVKAIVAGIVSQAPNGVVTVATLEGPIRGSIGDWIIQGVNGELYPCAADVFAASYDAVPDAA